MKNYLNLILVLIPLGLLAQGPQANYAYAEAVSAVEGTTAAFGFEVNDLLLADPGFDIQEDMVSYTKDGKKVFFSATKKLKLTDDNAEVKIKNSSRIHLFKADVAENGTWSNVEMLPFNGSNYSTGHPALNRDDSKLYFASDGPGSTGKTDLFTVDLFEDGTYGQPENLGNKVNSEERAIRPYVDAENVLYFASDEENDGKFLEVYASQVINGQASTPVKLDVAVDSPKEELIASYKAWYAEAVRKEEAMADMIDLAILQEAERLAEIERLEKELVSYLSVNAYDFNSTRTV